MPKLPDIEYAVVSQGPPNTMQAYGAVSDAISKLGQIGAQAQMAYAAELAKTDTSTARAVVESGMGQVENFLRTRPHVSRSELRSMLGGELPPDIEAMVPQGGNDDDRNIPTFMVGSAIHAAASRQITAEAAQGIRFSKIRSDFEQQTQLEGVQRANRMQLELAHQGAQYMAAQQLSTIDVMADGARTPEEWQRVYGTLADSGAIDPATKVKVKAQLDVKRTAQPVYDAIRTEDPEAIKAQLVRVDSDQEMVGMSPADRKALKSQLNSALTHIEEQADKARARAEKAAGDRALNAVDALTAEAMSGRPVSTARWLSVIPPVGSVSPQVQEHIQGIVANAMKPKEDRIKTDLGVYALVQNSRVTYPDEWAQGVVVLPNGKKTTLLALAAAGGLSQEDTKSLTKDQAEAFAKPDTARPDALQASDKAEVDRLLENQYRYKLDKKSGEYINQEHGKVAGWMYKVVESELAAEARKAPGGRLEVDQRNAVIRKTLAREIQLEQHWYGDSKKVAGMPIPPEFDAAFHALPQVPGRPVTHEFLAERYGTWVDRYQTAADEVWKAQTRGQALRARDAVYILAILDSRKTQIDEELKRAGQLGSNEAANDVKRAALATRFYWNSGIWRRR